MRAWSSEPRKVVEESWVLVGVRRDLPSMPWLTEDTKVPSETVTPRLGGGKNLRVCAICFSSNRKAQFFFLALGHEFSFSEFPSDFLFL